MDTDTHIQPADAAAHISALEKAVGEQFVGAPHIIHAVVIALCAGLNVLIEDIPGVGKTTLARALAAAAGLDFGRIQCTPDLLPGDITGMTIFDAESGRFVFRPGAVMHQFVLADELNRAATRTQAALLEAMQEGSVTIDDKTHMLPQPFFLVATENPMRFAGTFSLPEAQLDRFGIALSIGYPDSEAEKRIIDVAASEGALKNGSAGASRGGAPGGGAFRGGVSEATAAETTEDASGSSLDILALRSSAAAVRVDETIKDYAVAIAGATRRSPDIRLGVSPRGTWHLIAAARGQALSAGRDFVVPEDIRVLLVDVLAHRIVLSADARIEQRSAREILENLVTKIPMPSGI